MKWNATRFNTFCALSSFSECSFGLRLCTSLHRFSFNANNKPCREWQGMEAQLTDTALASRNCAKTLLSLARVAKRQGDNSEVSRLVRNARFLWRWYVREAIHA